MNELFTTEELESFGTFLLSAARTRQILSSDLEGDPVRLLAEVHEIDFTNWKALMGEAGVAMCDGLCCAHSANAKPLTIPVAEMFAVARPIA